MTRLARRRVVSGLLGALAAGLLLAGVALAANTVRSLDIVDGSVTTMDLRNGDVRSVDLRNANVLTADLGPGAVTGAKLANGSVGSSKLADGAVYGVDIADGSVASVDIADGGVGTADIADGSVTTTKLTPVEGWHTVGAANEPEFQNGWAAYTGNPVAFRKDRDGMVHIHGVPSRPASASTSTIFTLPVGYRPSSTHGFAVSTSTNPFLSDEIVTRIYISTDGAVRIMDDALDELVMLGHISFPAA